MKPTPLRVSALASCLAATLCHSASAPNTPPPSDAPPNSASTLKHRQIQPKLMLAKDHQVGINLQHYWISEKLDGVRAVWDGQQLRTRQGYPIYAPLWFTQPLPATQLDGELWIGRGQFDAVSAAVRRYQPIDKEWRSIQFRLLDLPASQQPFKHRAGQLKAIAMQVNKPHVQALNYQQVATETELQALLKRQVNKGAEGLMLNRIDAIYQAKRTDAILKLKPYQDDEAVVLAHLPGKGKYQGVLGSVLVQTKSGQQFRIGSGFSDQQRHQPPPVGTTITFKYFGLTASGKPRFASFLRRDHR